MARRFSVRQRVALWLASGGRCVRCGAALVPGWHADHVHPYSRGGATDVLNGQALCPSCNLIKGGTVELLSPWVKSLRTWQQDAFNAYVRAGKENFLLVATPGAGKTMAAARIAHALLSEQIAQQLVVIVPTAHLRRQWAESLATVGLHIDPRWQNGDGAIASDYCGMAVTYQQVAAAPDLHRMATRTRTLLIADEVHHAGDEKSWGTGLSHAYGHASRRLLLSGTPFRSDNSMIPWVSYQAGPDRVTRSAPDYSYGYGEALRDNAVRAIIFPSFDGTMEWSSGFEKFAASFTDELPEHEARRRLMTALNPQGSWIKSVMTEAHQRLREIRANGHPDAGGLVIANDHNHARGLAEVLRRISGETPVIALSDDPDASDRIKAFARGHTPWIVAVKMVSEGVDIPRLRVGIYATNTLTELFFRQVVGRFVRVLPNIDEQTAYLYIPAEARLHAHAQRIKDEIDHVLAEELNEARNAVKATASQERLYDFEGAEAKHNGSIFDHSVLTPDELARARALLEEASAAVLPAEKLALILRKVLREQPMQPPPVSAGINEEDVVEPLHKQKERMRRGVTKRVNILAAASNGTLDQRAIYIMLMQRDNANAKTATLEQLIERAHWLDEQIMEARCVKR